MKTVWKVLKWLGIGLICLLILIQLKRPARTNPAVDAAQTIEAHTQMSPQVSAILDRSCRDCHTNKTEWPWYTNVAPVSWWVIDHVDHGRSHLNISEWGKLDRDKQDKGLREICDEVSDGLMPLPSYLPLHPQAKLSEQDKKTLCEWTSAERQRLAQAK
jgi:hypothetical protein